MLEHAWAVVFLLRNYLQVALYCLIAKVKCTVSRGRHPHTQYCEVRVLAADVAVRGAGGQTALHVAAVAGASALVAELVQLKADPDALDAYDCPLAPSSCRKDIGTDLYCASYFDLGSRRSISAVRARQN